MKPSKPKLSVAVEEVPSADYLSLVWQHLTESLCEEVFAATRERERQRKWTLFALVWFWIALLQSRYGSQTRALLEARAGSPLFPPVDAAPAAFFQKVQAVRPAFFQNVFRAYTERLKPEAASIFEQELPLDAKLFPQIFAIDGSRLAKVGRLLKVARKTTQAILPGSLEAVYDLRRGLLHELHFDPDGCVAEIKMFEKILPSIPRGSLVVGDRYYAKPVFWRQVAEAGLFMVSRYNKTVKKRRVEVLGTMRSRELCVDDWLVDMGGSKAGTIPVRLRWVRLWNRQFELILITNVLDPSVLTPPQLLALYRRRWSVERMYLAMKDVLELNHLYNCSPAAVGQQVYATAILYNTLRVSQSKVAAAAEIPPENLSVDKLFPTLIDHYIKATYIAFGAEGMFERMKAEHPRLRRPEMKIDHPMLRIRIRDHLLAKRSERRRKRRFCKGRARATSYNKIPGAKKLLKN
ncbi:MAG TPA: IS4 family transposase [Woeseiaceae bacterium]|nr:IS4 family transposase [Woeseiaceae bacterium]